MAVRCLFAALFLVTGVLHFLVPQNYLKIMPPYLPWHLPLVYVSGLCEVLGGLGVLLPATRHAAAWGIIALLIAVVPANLYMVTDHAKFASIPLWAVWLRLPLQVLLIGWAWLYTRR